MNDFWIAIRFLTRLPAPMPEYDEAALARSAAYYGWVGLLLGVLAAAPLIWLQPPPLLSGALLVALIQWLSGGLHLDGLADCADAWVGGRDREHTLAIMKDPHVGAMGVATLVCVLLLQFAALSSLTSGLNLLLCVAATCGGSRLGAAWLLKYSPYVRPGGLGEALTQASPASLALHSTLLFGLLAALAPVTALLSAASCFAVMWLGRRACLNRLGGLTGDTVGALIVLAETVTLLVHALR